MKKTIYVEPVGKARARTVRTRGGKTITYTPGKTVHAENLIRDAILEEEIFFPKPLPLRIIATFYRSRPKALAKRFTLPIARPDFDNYTKLLTDALEKFIYEDDSQITTAIIRKRFGSPPRIELELEVDQPLS